MIRPAVKRSFERVLLVSAGNVLVDRYKSLQRRNIIEPRVRQRVVLKYKHKVFKKRSHVEPTGVRIGRNTKLDDK